MTPRCKLEGIPKQGRFTAKKMEQIISQAKLNIEEFMLYFKDTDNAVNYMNEYSGLIHLAIYRAMVKEGCKYQREMRDFISA